jgi:lycopene beta-cyclase
MSVASGMASIAVIGGGLAGLSLALRLQDDRRFRGRMTLYEARPVYADDRRWSYWSCGEHPFSRVIAAEYPRLQLVCAGRRVAFDCAALPYRCHAAGDIYAEAVRRLSADSRFELRMGTPATMLRPVADGVSVRVAGEEQAHDLVLDGRPGSDPPEFLQWFVGGELELPAGMPMPAPVLMDFDAIEAPSPDAPVAFAYVLPQGARRVLVQLTWFLPRGVAPPADARRHWTRYVAHRLDLDPARLHREESGAIPMGIGRVAPTADPRIVRIGAAAGWVRAATGYGFVDIQRASARMAEALLGGDVRALGAVRPRPRADDAMDAILLEAMRTHPRRVGDWFLRLFAAVPAPRLIRFLSGEASATDRLAVMAALPAAPFLAAGWRRMRKAPA